MAWLLLALAICAEIAATATIKHTSGLNIVTHTFPTVAAVAGYLAAYILLAQSVRLGMHVSVAYAVWSGAGTAAIAALGALLWDEPLTVAKTAGMALIVAGVALLYLAPAPPPAARP